MGATNNVVGPISIKDASLTIPSPLSDRGVDGFIDSVFGVNTIYSGDGARSFVMKDGFPAVYYKGEPYRIESCDGRSSFDSTDGNSYFELYEATEYHCVVEVKKEKTLDPSKNVKVRVLSEPIEEKATEGYKIVTDQIICKTPLADTTARPSQFHTGTIDSLDDFEGKPPFSVELAIERTLRLYLWIPAMYSAAYKGMSVKIEESTPDGWYCEGGAFRSPLEDNSDYYFWFEHKDRKYTAHVGKTYPPACIGVTKILHTYSNGMYESYQSGGMSFSELDLIEPCAHPFKVSVNAVPRIENTSAYIKSYYIYVPDSEASKSVVCNGKRVPVEFSDDFSKVAEYDNLYKIEMGISCNGVISFYKTPDGSIRAKLHIDSHQEPKNAFRSYPIFTLSDGAFTQDAVYNSESIIQCTKGTIILTIEPNGCFEVLESTSQARENGSKSFSFSNLYYNVGGRTYVASSKSLTIGGGEFVALKVNATGSQPSAEVVTYSDLSALQAAQKDLSYFIRPIYKFDSEGNIECDFRKMVSIDMAEFVDND